MSALTRRAALVALGVSALVGCGSEAPPNLVLVTLDTTRADRLGLYGYPEGTSPTLDALGAESLVFDNAFSMVPVTLPAHTSMLSGLAPLAHGVRDNGRFVVPDDLETLPVLLSESGFETAAFVSGFVLDSRFGLDRGFDLYDDAFTDRWSESKLRDARIYNQMVTDRPADQTTDRALEWLDGDRREPYFLWVHYYDPHQRYAPPRPFDQRFPQSPYDGEIAFMDSQIARLFERIRERGEWERTAILVTADHGEGFGQHGEATHGVLAYDATLRVPMMVKPPGGGPAPARIEEPVSHLDIFTTFAALGGLDSGSDLRGRDLLQAASGRFGSRPAYFECALPRFSFGWESLFGVRADGWKYIRAPRPELYDLQSDPDELYNLVDREPERAAAMEGLLFRWVEEEATDSSEAAGEMSDDVRRRLEALGYLTGGSASDAELTPREPTGLRSPNEGITFLADYYLANALAGRGQLREAAEIYSNVLVPLDPSNPTFLGSLANLERKLGRSEAAFSLFRQAQAADPEDPETLVALAQLEYDRGEADSARDLLSAARQVAPSHLTAAFLTADLESREGRQEIAVEAYRRTLKIDPSHRDSWIGLGIALGRLDRLDEAREALVRSLEVAPFSARAHYNLGLLEMRSGRPSPASDAFERALRYQQPYPAATLGLASAWIELGETARAKELLTRLAGEARRESAIAEAKRLLAELEASSTATRPEG